jgi:hypothetical protein
MRVSTLMTLGAAASTLALILVFSLFAVFLSAFLVLFYCVRARRQRRIAQSRVGARIDRMGTGGGALEPDEEDAFREDELRAGQRELRGVDEFGQSATPVEGGSVLGGATKSDGTRTFFNGWCVCAAWD